MPPLHPRLHPEPRVGYALSGSQEWLEESDSEEDSSSDDESEDGEDGDQEEDSAEEGAGESHAAAAEGPCWAVLGLGSKQVAIQCTPA